MGLIQSKKADIIILDFRKSSYNCTGSWHFKAGENTEHTHVIFIAPVPTSVTFIPTALLFSGGRNEGVSKVRR